MVQIKGSITYNGHTFDDFIPERTASYIDQTDTHLAELTVRETFDFGARCQGTGHKAGTSLILVLTIDEFTHAVLPMSLPVQLTCSSHLCLACATLFHRGCLLVICRGVARATQAREGAGNPVQLGD